MYTCINFIGVCCFEEHVNRANSARRWIATLCLSSLQCERAVVSFFAVDSIAWIRRIVPCLRYSATVS